MSPATLLIVVLLLLGLASACNESVQPETDAGDVDLSAELDVVDVGDTTEDPVPDAPTACDDHPDIWPTVLDPCDCRGTSYRRYIERFDSDGQFLGGCTMEASCAAGSWGTAWIIFDYCESDAG